MHYVILFFVSGFLQAKEVRVSHKYLSYKINYDENQVVYSGSNVLLSLNKKGCNEHIIKKFTAKMNSTLVDDLLEKPEPNTYVITVDQVAKYDLLSSKRAPFFANFDDYFKQLKIEEILSCK